MSMNRTPSTSPRGVLKLKRPMSVAIYDEYSDAAHAVDYLGDRQFPVENLAIFGMIDGKRPVSRRARSPNPFSRTTSPRKRSTSDRGARSLSGS